ncbi:unnamed protein product [Malus baccata var. baccata]
MGKGISVLVFCGGFLTSKMPKVRRDSSLSLDRSRASPYPCTSDDSDAYNLKNPLESKDNAKEWEEARCPICMEHAHNAVLLKCSSHEKGCRPFMCNTSYRHSNCFDQFCKSSSPCCSTVMLQELPLTHTSHIASEEQSSPGQSSPCGSQLDLKPVCPLCRGEIYGYVVVEAARHFMNAKVRNCSSETCDFSGTYSELRKHARSEHPSVRPSEVDPNRHSDWVRLERERDLEDVLSLVQQGPGDELLDDSSGDLNSWMSTVFAAMFRSLEVMLVTRLMDSSSGSSSGREQQTHNRRSGRTSRVHYDNDTIPSTRRSNNVSDSTSRPRRLRWRALNDDVGTSRSRWGRNSMSGEAGGHAPRWGNSLLSEQNSRTPRWGNNSLSEEANHAPRWGNNPLSEETSRASRMGNNSLTEETSRWPRWGNNTLPEESSRASIWGNNSLREETNRAPRWGNNSLTEETSRAPRWGNASAPENTPRTGRLRWRNQRWPTNNRR